MLGIILALAFVALLGIMAFEAYILSPKRMQDANRILYEISKSQSEYERNEMRIAYDEIIEEEQNITYILMIAFMVDMLVNLFYIIICKPFD